MMNDRETLAYLWGMLGSKTYLTQEEIQEIKNVISDRFQSATLTGGIIPTAAWNRGEVLRSGNRGAAL